MKSFLALIVIALLFFSRAWDCPLHFTNPYIYPIAWYPIWAFALFLILHTWKRSQETFALSLLSTILTMLILLYSVAWEGLLAIAGFPVFEDVCKVGNRGPFTVYRQRRYLAQSHQDWRTQAVMQIVPGVRLAFPVSDAGDGSCKKRLLPRDTEHFRP